MTAVAALRQEPVFELKAPPPSRDEALRLYRRAREISKRHHAALQDTLSWNVIVQHARRLGLLEGKTFLLDTLDDMTLAVDLAIHTAPPDRSRAIDRYANSTRLAQGSEEAMVLDAMRKARFALLLIRERHPSAGVIVSDLIRETDLWLMDEGIETSLPDGSVVATRYYSVGSFVMTAGVCLPIQGDALALASARVPQLARKAPPEAIQDRRFAEAIYRGALRDGTMERVQLRDAPSPDEEA